MSKYINLEKQLVRLYRLGIDSEEVIKQFLLTACTEDVQKVQHGKWIDSEDPTCHKCSVCGEYATQEYGLTEPIFWKYCPNCGAKMNEEVDEAKIGTHEMKRKKWIPYYMQMEMDDEQNER